MNLTKGIVAYIILAAFISNSYTQHKDHTKEQSNDPDKSRFYWQMPNRIIEEIGVEEGMVVADVGSGKG